VKAVVLQPNHEIAVEDVSEPRIEKGSDVLLKITKTAICGSDIHIKQGMLPVNPGTVMGHEFTGVVTEVGSDVTRFKPGDRVSAPPAVWCGTCPACKRGQAQYCDHLSIWGSGDILGKGLTGAQTEYVRMPNAELCLTLVPNHVPDEDAVFVGDVFGTGYHAAREGNIRPGDTVAVYGCGPIGLGAIAAGRQFGPSRILAVDLLSNRLDIAEKFGATIVRPAKGDASEEIMNMTEGRGVDVAIEAIGSPVTFEQALHSVRRGGSLSIVGLYAAPVEFPAQELSMHGIRLSMGLGDLTYGERLMSLVASGRVSLKEMATRTFPISEARAAYDLFENHKDECIKVLIEP
jgi:threonine dehydrogenase-like Zn-dependent dehydrogenase